MSTEGGSARYLSLFHTSYIPGVLLIFLTANTYLTAFLDKEIKVLNNNVARNDKINRARLSKDLDWISQRFFGAGSWHLFATSESCWVFSPLRSQKRCQCLTGLPRDYLHTSGCSEAPFRDQIWNAAVLLHSHSLSSHIAMLEKLPD